MGPTFLLERKDLIIPGSVLNFPVFAAFSPKYFIKAPACWISQFVWSVVRGIFCPFHKENSCKFHTCEERQTKRHKNGNNLFVLPGRAGTEDVGQENAQSRAMKPHALRSRPSLGHHPTRLVAEIPAPALDVCAMQGHQPAPTLGSLASDRQQRCDVLAISSSLRILKGPKPGKSPSVPRWSQGRCWSVHFHIDFTCTGALLVTLSKQNRRIPEETLKWAPGHTNSPLNFDSFILFSFWNHIVRGDKNEILFCSWIVVYWSSN